jgi:tellurite methyltransferase
MTQQRTFTDTYWPDYYEVTAERPAWATVKRAAEAFGTIDPKAPRTAVDLGCGAGRDSRELLRRGWRVISMDMSAQGIEMLRELTPGADQHRLETHVVDLADFEIPRCDLLNADLILPFLAAGDYTATWGRIRAALGLGARFSGMLFGDLDESADDPNMTCASAEVIRGHLDGFEIEHWSEKEEDGETALGEAHHFHLIEVVAVRRDTSATGTVG